MIKYLRNLSNKGSVSLMAFMVLGVIFVIGLAFRQFTMNSVLQIYRFKTNEISLAMGDGLLDISKKIAESLANTPGSKLDEMLTKMQGDQTGPEELFSIESGVVKGAAGDYSDVIAKLLGNEEGAAEKITAKVKIILSKDQSNKFPSRDGVTQYKGEFKGKATLIVHFWMDLKIKYKGSKSGYLQTTPKTMQSTFEFKRVRIQAPVVRHFTFFGADLGNDENGADYTGGKFNKLYVNSEGSKYGGKKGGNYPFAYLTLNNGSDSNFSAIAEKERNPFKTDIGYVYMGTGGDDSRQLYLNLTAGKAEASESFHLYRGNQGESDFYRLFTADYKTTLTKDYDGAKEPSHKTQFQKVRDLLSPENGEKYKDSASNGLPYYYLSRKDYGYSAAWEKHPEFGFKRSTKGIPANNFHLFGRGEEPSFSVVFGNVYRRCLSLAGYKQRKAPAQKKKGKRSFEFQAGPIYFYGNYKELHAHKLFINETISGSGGSSEMDIRNDPKYAPIEVWDQRMNWQWPQNKEAEKMTGSWVFVSGDGLMGRLVPSIIGFYEKKPDFFSLSTSITGEKGDPKSDKIYGQTIENAIERSDSQQRLISPLIEEIYKRYKGDGGDGFPVLFEDKGGVLSWTSKGSKISAYYKELLLMFYYNSYQAVAAFHVSQGEDLDQIQSSIEDFAGYTTKNDQDIIKSGALRWFEIMDLLQGMSDKGEKYSLKKAWSMSSGAFASKSKAIKMRQWNPTNSGESNGKPHYFTLPDPWLSRSSKPLAIDRDIEETVKGNDTYMTKHENLGSEGGGEYLFKFFRRLMTDPAWVLPYNYSSRFYFPKLKEVFFAKGASAPNREELMANSVIPEIRDSIGYVGASNPYMNLGDEGKPTPLNEAAQRNIVKEYKKDANKDKGYFFVKEMTGDSLAEVDLESLYNGRCIFQFDNEEGLRRRLVKTDGKLDTSVCVNNLTLPISGINMTGKGVIYVRNNLKITEDIDTGGLLVLMAKSIDIKSGKVLNNVSLIQTSGKFSARFRELNGNLVVKELNNSIGGTPVVRYNRNLKADDYVVSFQPFINTWEMCGNSEGGC
ncbi:MAG: hypothetical protein KC646_14160 [Candidatus Cloacimonetes bacterium]|nr:hypothetical protein [Candidatus Cloacimonadota bacterium]